MVDMEKLARSGFKIIDGRLCDRYGSSLGVTVREFGWGSPCNEYHFDDYALSAYTIEKSVHYDNWYLKKNGYSEVCELYHKGGKNWETR